MCTGVLDVGMYVGMYERNDVSYSFHPSVSSFLEEQLEAGTVSESIMRRRPLSSCYITKTPTPTHWKVFLT